ncbi:MAG: hypothetical protein JWO90_2728, partial [Solirubrobacterales bacterium]|nr:hypothetical protein [Solirubrobacterales bacterium]
MRGAAALVAAVGLLLVPAPG